jgi:hypothetical protein
MTPRQHKTLASRLALASHLLAGAAVVQLGLFLPRLVPGAGNKIFLAVTVVSAVLAIAGFMAAYKPLGTGQGMSDANAMLSPLGWKTHLSVVLMFCGAFLVPVLNLVIILWTWFRVRGAIGNLALARQEYLQAEARRIRMRSG